MPQAPGLRLVSTPLPARTRARAAVGCVGLLVAGLIGLLLLNVSLERGAYQLKASEREIAQLQEQRQELHEELVVLQAPQNLAGAAQDLGMVRNPNAAFVRSPDGQVLGVPQQAATPPAHSVDEG
jgi:hypothetical protein